MKKSFVCLILCLLAPMNADAQRKPLDDGLYYEFNNGSLIITGNGKISELEYHYWFEDIRKTAKEIVVKNGITAIGNRGFSSFPAMTSISLSSSIKTIGEYAFSGCENLTSIKIPSSVTKIGKGAFQGCTNLQSITLPNSLLSIEESAFNECINLRSISLPNSLSSICNLTFSGCKGLTSIAIPNSVTSIGKSAFVGCESLTNIVIPSSVKVIEEGAFSGCRALTSINLPNSMVSIGEFAFSGCTNLQSISLPNSITSIGKYAFSQCKSLKSITIPNSLKNIEDGAFFTDFYENLEIVSIPQWLIDKGKDEWTRCGLSETAVKRYMMISAIREKGGYTNVVELMNGSTNYYKVNKGGKYGLTNAEGKVIVPTEMEDLEAAGTGYLRYKLNGFWGLMNFTGKIIIDTDRGYTKIGDYVSFTKRFPYEMAGYKGECNNLGVQVSKIKVNKPVAQQSIGSSSSSKTSNDLATFDLKGNVKKCVMGSDTQEFDRNGKLIVSGNQEIIYDNKGRISEIKVGIDRLGGGYKYEYDNNGRVKIEVSLLSLLGNTAEMRNQFFYNNKGQIVKKILTTNDGAEQTIIYSDYTYDSHGNWISRKKDGSTIETRTIEYY